jgi:soluble lytic murein transglycosylase
MTRLTVVFVTLIMGGALLLTGCASLDKGISSISNLNLSKLYYQLEYASSIAAAATVYDVDPYLVAAVIKCESNFDPQAISSAHSKGLMQVGDEAANDMASFGYVDEARYASDNLFDPETNIFYGTAYLSYLLERYDGNEEAAIAAYNAGPRNVDEWMNVGNALADAIDFAETKAYLVNVMTAKEVYKNGYPHAFE